MKFVPLNVGALFSVNVPCAGPLTSAAVLLLFSVFVVALLSSIAAMAAATRAPLLDSLSTKNVPFAGVPGIGARNTVTVSPGFD
jgi:hypothetical protein